MHLEKTAVLCNGKKTKFFTVSLDMPDGKECRLMVVPRHAKVKLLHNVIDVLVPYKYNISYDDVLDACLKAMEKNGSACLIVDTLFFRACHEPFLKKGATLEELAVEFDLTWRDVFNYYCKEP